MFCNIHSEKYLYYDALCSDMECQFIDLDFTDEEYEIITAFCRIYHIALEDGLIAVLILLGEPVGLNRRVLKVRWNLFCWGIIHQIRSLWLPDSEDIILLKQMRIYCKSLVDR